MVEDEVVSYAEFKKMFLDKFKDELRNKETDRMRMYRKLIEGSGNSLIGVFVYELIKLNKKADMDLSEILREIANRFPGALRERVESCNAIEGVLEIISKNKKFVEGVGNSVPPSMTVVRVSKGRNAEPKGIRVTESVKCFKCGGPHYRNKCPKL